MCTTGVRPAVGIITDDIVMLCLSVQIVQSVKGAFMYSGVARHVEHLTTVAMHVDCPHADAPQRLIMQVIIHVSLDVYRTGMGDDVTDHMIIVVVGYYRRLSGRNFGR